MNQDQLKTLTRPQLYQLSKAYDVVARAMPLEGRDYDVNIGVNADDKLTINITGKTQLGKAFAEHCIKQLIATIKEEHNGSGS